MSGSCSKLILTPQYNERENLPGSFHFFMVLWSLRDNGHCVSIGVKPVIAGNGFPVAVEHCLSAA